MRPRLTVVANRPVTLNRRFEETHKTVRGFFSALDVLAGWVANVLFVVALTFAIAVEVVKL